MKGKRSRHDPESKTRVVLQALKGIKTIHQIRLHHTQSEKPMRNGYIEHFIKIFRDGVIDANLFSSLSEVRESVRTTRSITCPHNPIPPATNQSKNSPFLYF